VTDPSRHIWWLASRASGIVALALVAASVTLGLAMATKLMRGRDPAAFHEHLSLAGLVAISVHGLTLLGDPWLHPGLAGIAVPFWLGYRTAFTGLGIIAGYLAAALGLSFYVRRHLPRGLWRRLHRLTIVVYVLALVHTLGGGTDATTPWLRMFMLATAVPIGVLLLARLAPRPPRAGRGVRHHGLALVPLPQLERKAGPQWRIVEEVPPRRAPAARGKEE
jgi:sulfoxide reductase heme-binding subunit YedZ